ncbi:roadblock/LC7 domain-containing protein [Nocardia sp. NBC_01327]|uniref:roadblock/LC7 domain-containing protein n=1 Tax=Nocardia sp. NBC_01327 TaxID=2903593 RepID=UPI002E0E9C04|nr:roadblock/LC7 domain-containing protein [Nocardia sp. NBC_01327]
MHSHPESSNSDIEAHLSGLRQRVPHLVGSVVASSDGLLIAADLPESIEPTGIAALAAAQLSLSLTFVATTHGSSLHEVTIDSGGGHVVVYAAGPTALLAVLTDPDAVLGRVHLEARPVARAIADLSTPSAPPAEMMMTGSGFALTSNGSGPEVPKIH